MNQTILVLPLSSAVLFGLGIAFGILIARALKR
jgi:hypothetical protein